MDSIVNEVELKKVARENQKIEQLKKEGKKPDEIKELTESKEPKKEVTICRTLYDVQKRKLDKMMSDPTKDVYIPQARKEWKPREAPEFVRHVMGSSAGAGSGEFHVYRGLRKREKKRQDYLERKTIKTELDEKFEAKMNENKTKAEETTAKKRAKRQRKKQKKLLAKKLKKSEAGNAEEKSSSENEADEEIENGVDESHFVIGGK